MDCRTALATVLDSVDYMAGNCRPNEMVGAVLPKEMIMMARKAIADFDKSIAKGLEIANEVYKEQAAAQQRLAADETYCAHDWSFPPEFCPVCGKRVPVIRLTAKA